MVFAGRTLSRAFHAGGQSKAKPVHKHTSATGDGPKLYQFILSGSHNRILYFRIDGGAQHVTKLHYTWLPVLVLSAFCTICRAGPVWRGSGAQFGRKTVENRPKQQFIFELLIMTATKYRV